MSADQSTPSKDPANQGSLAGTFRQILHKFKQGQLDDMLPARVVAYDRATNTATVQPLVQVVTTNKVRVSRPQIASVPVLALGTVSFVINFPIAPGDVGWIKANDRDISTYLNNLVEVSPPTRRMHSFSDGLFIPDAVKNFEIDAEDSDAMVIQLSDSTAKLAIHQTGEVVLKSKEGEIRMSSDGKYNFTGLNGADELMQILVDFGNVMKSAQVFPTTPMNPATQAAIQAIIDRLDLMKI